MTNERVRIWGRIRLGRERGVDEAREMGCRDCSGITHLVKGLELQGLGEKRLQKKLEGLRMRFSIFKS